MVETSGRSITLLKNFNVSVWHASRRRFRCESADARQFQQFEQTHERLVETAKLLRRQKLTAITGIEFGSAFAHKQAPAFECR